MQEEMMKRSEYLKTALDAYHSGRVNQEVYDAMIMNADVFCDDDDDDDDDDGDSDDSDYIRSCTARDYSPSNPWDAPGMSISDFI